MKKSIAIFLALILAFSTISYARSNALTRLEAVYTLAQLLPEIGEGIGFDDTNDRTVAYFNKLGIVQGTGKNLFKPNEHILTQDFLVMLKKTIDRVCPNLFYDNQRVRWYYDQNEIEEYAQSYVRFLSTLGIYDSDGVLMPRSIISQHEADEFIKLAQNAIENATKSSDGEMYQTKPPILMYHVIGYPGDINKYLFVTPEDFEEQIKYMYDNGYTFLFPEELSLADSVSKPVVITFDDGYVQTYTNAYRILKKYNAKATLYIYTDAIDRHGYCSSSQLKEMSDTSVFRIYSHTKTHGDLSQMSTQEIIEEFSHSNDKIYNITKREVTSIAYPFGFCEGEVLGQAKRYYKTGFAVNKGEDSTHDITRMTVDGTCSFEEFLKLIK